MFDPHFDIQTQIMDRVYKFIHNEDGRLFLGKDARIRAGGVGGLPQQAEEKSRHLILKMSTSLRTARTFSIARYSFVTKTRLMPCEW